MRFSFVLVCSLAMLASACTPISPNKAANSGPCKTNSDCKSNVCKENKCVNHVDCNDLANVAEPFCQNILCNVPSDCPKNFSCLSGTCTAAVAGACIEDTQCAGSDTGEHCLQQSSTDPTKNKCVECIDNSHCPKDKTCNTEASATVQAYTCVDRPKTGCKSKSDCLSSGMTTPTPACDTKTKKCVECVLDADCKTVGKPLDSCRNDVCVAPDPTADCTKPGISCPTAKPICDTPTKVCVACDASHACPDPKICVTNATASNVGQCVSADSTCSKNSDCTNSPGGVLDGTINGGLKLNPAQVGANATFWCDSGGVASDPPVKACKPCRLAGGNTDCDAGYTCSLLGGANVCVPTGAVTCDKTAATCADGEACTILIGHANGTCTSTCATTGLNTCKPPFVCNPNSGACEAATSCAIAPGNNQVCEDNGLVGFACMTAGAGSAKICLPCDSDLNCQTSPGGKTRCGTTDKRCDAPLPTLKKLGDTCQNGLLECESGTCLTFDPAPGAQGFCSQVCSRTKSSAGTANDCPIAPDASVIASRGAGKVKASQGFACLNGTYGSDLDGLGVCVLPYDYDLFYQRGAFGTTSAFTVPGGVAPLTSGLTCQATYASNSFGTGTTLCDYVCGNSDDCTQQGLSGYSCIEVLTSPTQGQAHGVGRHVCRPTETDKAVAGDFCRAANECQEHFCDGRVIARFLPVTPAVSCPASACAAGDSCINGLCHTPTKRAMPLSCDSDTVCQKFNGPGRTKDQCWDHECYPPQAAQDIACQDDNGVPKAGLQFCAGRCGKHCNSEADCVHDATADLLLPDMLCNYRPSSPSPTDDYISGDGWSRVCVNRTPVNLGTDPDNDHTRVFNEPCANDNLECRSEICAQGKDLQTYVCTQYCGNASVCPAGYVCSVVESTSDPKGGIAARKLLKPICLKP